MLFKWLLRKRIQKIRYNKRQLAIKWKDYLNYVKHPMLKITAAQILENQNNQTENCSYWDEIKYILVSKIFEFIDESDYLGNIVGLGDDNKVIVLDDNREVIWSVNPIERPLFKFHVNNIEDFKVVNNIDVFYEIALINAKRIVKFIISEIIYDLENIYCKNDIIQYNYCIHSFYIDESEYLKMRYIKTATFGE